MSEPDQRDRFRGSLLGLAIGDAVGTTVEFMARGSFAPVAGMTGGGPFNLQAGQWTDDTSMALCLAASLIEQNSFDARDQMARYCRWAEQGYLSSTGSCFDIGGTVRTALRRFRQTGDPFAGSTSPDTAGNGSIMRLAPVPIWCHPDIDAAERLAAESSRTTHGAAECVDACRLLARVIHRALDGQSRETVVMGDAATFQGSEKIVAIARGEYRYKVEAEISGSGYVVDSLEAALWCFLRATSFEEAVLIAANLGDDADTTAAVCGQVAGAYYGVSGIPSLWLEKVVMRAEITEYADRLRSAGQ